MRQLMARIIVDFAMIQYASDLHLEFFGRIPDFKAILRPVAPYLVLAGDIGQPGHLVFHQFLDYVSTNWKAVILIAGNHEFYANQQPHKWNARWNKSPPRAMTHTIQALLEACVPYPNLYFLHADSPVAHFPDDNLVFIGLTLWSHIPADQLARARRVMNDYEYIPVVNMDEEGKLRPWTPEESCAEHARERAVLEATIAEWSTRSVDMIVVTHHMPSFSLVASQYKDDPLNCCFATNFDAFILANPAIKAWIYGHTHSAGVHMIGSTLCAINARGYPKSGTEVVGYSPEKTLRPPVD